ncbi:MAG: BspA family leucine-rich repeat surface protein, partial [Clostridia bacterium]|nr:BspA family leucine-rich repeat surface protein [Clostridia bacterium]
MKKMGKQANIWAYVGFTLTLVLAMVGIFAFGLGSHTRTRADSVEAATSGDWTYTVASNKATITAYSGTATDLTIPSTLGGYSVTQIGSSSASATFLTNVRTTLTKVTIPTSVTSIGTAAFYNCTALTNVVYADGKGANLAYYGGSCFRGCTALQSFRISDGVTKFYAQCFRGCTKLASVTFPCKNIDTNTEIAFDGSGFQFAECSKLVNIYVTEPVSGIRPRYGVDGVGGFYRLRYDNNVSKLDCLIFSATGYTGDASGTFTLPSTVTGVINYAFTCAAQHIKIPANTSLDISKVSPVSFQSRAVSFDVETPNSKWYSIDGVAYYNNNGTKSLVWFPPRKNINGSFTIGDDINIISKQAFGAAQIKQLTWGNNIREIGYRALWKSRINTVSPIPASVQVIDNSFVQTPLSSISVSPDSPYFKSENNCIYSKDGKTLYFVLVTKVTNLSILEGTENIVADCAMINANFLQSTITNITIPSSMKTINASAFYANTTVANVTFLHKSIPQGFTINNGAFTSVNSSLVVNLQNRAVTNYFKSHFTTSQFTNAPSCFKCLDYTVTLTLNNNGDTSIKLYSWGNGSNYSMYSNANHTTSASSVTVPTRTGYTFDGYWLDKDGDSTQYITKTGAFVSGIADIDADSTLYAHWIPATPLLWSTLGGAAKIYPLDSETGIVRAEVTEAYAGYTFAGWSLNDGTNISSYTVEGGNPKKVVDIPASVLNGKILIASFKQNNTVVDTYANTTHNYLVATTNGGYARILGENASATAVRIRAQTTDPDYKFSHWTLTNLGTGEVTKLLNGMPLTETEDYVSFNCVVPLSMLDGKILTAVFKTTKPSNVNLTVNYIPATLPAQFTFSTYIDNTVTAVVFDWFTDDLARSYLVNGTNVISGLTAVNVSTNEFPIYKYLNTTNHTLYFLTMTDVHIVATSNITFDGKSTLTSLIFRNFDTSLMTSMSCMFRNCNALETLDVSNFDTSNVTAMGSMFGECFALKSVDVSNFDTSKVVTMDYMFSDCNSLSYVDVSNFDTSKVTNMVRMFRYCTSMVSLDLSSFNTALVTNMWEMFRGCDKLRKLDISSFNTAKVTSTQDMFTSCSALNSLDLSNFNTGSVTNMVGMFNACSGLTYLNVSSFNTSKVEYMHYMFQNCSSLTTVDVSGFDTSKVYNMRNMFYGCTYLTTLDVSNWNVSKVTNFSSMFDGCYSLISLDFSNWQVSNVSSFSWFLSRCTSLTGVLDFSGFNTAATTVLTGMCGNCYNVSSIILGSNFTTASATEMKSMFANCRTIKTLDLSMFNISNVTTMEAMFSGCYSLETIYVGSNWNNNHSLTSANTFAGCTSLKGWYQNGTALASNDFNSQNTSAAYAKIAASGNGCYLTNINLKSTLE